jgi:tripartite-type tricarboxylate transporter receptor subunit TctC
MDQHRRTLLATLAVTSASPSLWADEVVWPGKALYMVCPTGAAGPTDIRSRWLAPRLSQALGQQVVVENRAGAGGNIGAEAVAHGAADGYRLLMAHQGLMTINPHLYPNLGFDPLSDFAPVTRVCTSTLVLTVHPSVPARSLGEFIALAKARPGRMNFGSPGIGTPPHMACELLKHSAGIEATHIPFTSGAALATALIGGQIDWTMDGMVALLPHVSSGRLRALAVSSAESLASLPGTPTFAEAGLPGYEYTSWTGIVVPAATPKAIVERLYAVISAILSTADAREWFAVGGGIPGGEAPEVFARLIRAEHAKWGPIIRAAGIKPA